MRRLWYRKTRRPPVPVTLNHRAIYILPTGYGLLFIGVLFGMLIGSMNYNNNLGFLLTFLLGNMAFVSLFHTHRNLSGLRIHSLRGHPAFAGERAAFEIGLQAGSQPVQSLMLSFDQGGEATADLGAGESRRISLTLPTHRRGRLRPGTLRVETLYPLGLFRAWAVLSTHVEAVIYPRPRYAPLSAFGQASQSGQEQGEPGGPGVEDFEGLRAYQPGDPLRQISWKAFSRGQGLFTKTFVGQKGGFVLLDWQRLRENDVEARLSMLSHLVLAAHQMQMNYGLNLPDQSLPPDRGEAHKHRCLKALALFGLPLEAR